MFIISISSVSEVQMVRHHPDLVPRWARRAADSTGMTIDPPNIIESPYHHHHALRLYPGNVPSSIYRPSSFIPAGLILFTIAGHREPRVPGLPKKKKFLILVPYSPVLLLLILL